MPLPYNTISEKFRLLDSGKLSLYENLEHFHSSAVNSDINAFITVCPKKNFLNKAIEPGLLNRTNFPLSGLVMGIKDVLAVEDLPLTCASSILSNFLSPYTAESVHRLVTAGALILGKTNCDEFAMGSSNENSAFGKVLNPINKERVPGGSSGGSAAAVAGGLCDIALGSDTGGSVRQPAGFCGIYGFKPTYSRISRYGLTAFASSFDSVGIFARHYSDIPLPLSIMSGKDEKDSTSTDSPIQFLRATTSTEIKPVIGIISGTLDEGLQPEIKIHFNNLVQKLAKYYTVKTINLPLLKYAISVYYILTMAEASSNLSRYDGARYGNRHSSDSLAQMLLSSRSIGFGNEVKRRIMLGTYILSSGYYDAYFAKAQKVRNLFRKQILDAFKEVNLVLTPTSPSTAFKSGEKTGNPLEMYLSDVFTVSANIVGAPGISIPYGFDNSGLPIGMQLMAAPFMDEFIFSALGEFDSQSILTV